MFLRAFKSVNSLNFSAKYSLSFKRYFKVAIWGVAGGVGQPLSMTLKQSHYIEELALYDIVNTKGIAMDVGHVNTKCKVQGYTGCKEIVNVLKVSLF